MSEQQGTSPIVKPTKLARHLRRLRRRWRHKWQYYVRWPTPLWRLKGYAWLTLEGHRFKFAAEDVTIWWAMKVWRGKGEKYGMSFLAQALQPGDIFFDIGAWAGPYSLLAARLVEPGGKVYAFEPDPVARALLERNIAANDITNVTVLPYAVADGERSAWLGSPRLGETQSFVDDAAGLVPIQMVSLTGYCERQALNPAVVKIDVEGAEAWVLAGGADVLRRARAILLEVHDPKLLAFGCDPAAFRQSINELGKQVTVLHHRPDAGVSNLGLAESGAMLDPCAGRT